MPRPSRSRRARSRVTMTIRKTDDGQLYAWIETRLPGGRWWNRRAAITELRRQYPEATGLRVLEQWHVPLKHHAFKIQFDLA